MNEPVFVHTADEFMVLENSFGTLTEPQTVSMTTKVWLSQNNPDRGWFTWGDGEDWYAEGGLWFDGEGFLSDFDGVFDLPPAAIKWLYDEGRLTQWFIDMWTKSGRLEVSE